MGTRAEIIKMAPLYYALKEIGAHPVVWHVGQHEKLAWPFYEFFRISPELHLPLSRKKPTLGHLSALIMEKLDNALKASGASCMIVQGDTSSAFIAALTAFYYKIPIAHVEAGLRTFREYEPFPEEKNRELISRLARWHFAPSEKARKNLEAEGIPPEAIYLVGNTIVDATLWGVNHLKINSQPFADLRNFPVRQYENHCKSRRLIVVTAHRRENWDNGIKEIAASVRATIEKHDDVFIVWPVHPNPIIKKAILKQIDPMSEQDKNRILLTQPIDYPVMLHLLRDAWLILTDSGGIQEEAIILGVPVLVLRETTERPEVISAGGGALVGVEIGRILQWMEKLTTNKDIYDAMRNCPNPYGDGQASKNIAKILMKNLQ